MFLDLQLLAEFYISLEALPYFFLNLLLYVFPLKKLSKINVEILLDFLKFVSECFEFSRWGRELIW